MSENKKIHELVIIGTGPAGLSAAIYTTREDIETLLIEKGVIGGLAAITDWIDNYPGFKDGLSGMDLAEAMHGQAERFGAKIELANVESLKKDGKNIVLNTTNGLITTKALLITTGTDYKKIGVPGEDEFFGRGVHYCATCDGAFYRDKKLVVVGGGNSAVQEAIFLTKFATHIDMLVRSDKLRASEVLQHELGNHKDKIKVHYNTTTDKIIGIEKDGFMKVSKVIGTDKKSNQKVEFSTDGVFVFVGLKPNTGFLAGSGVKLDRAGFIETDSELRTAVPGIFCAGDVRSGATMQIASASGEGATAALKIREFLKEHSKLEP